MKRGLKLGILDGSATGRVEIENAAESGVPGFQRLELIEAEAGGFERCFISFGLRIIGDVAGSAASRHAKVQLGIHDFTGSLELSLRGLNRLARDLGICERQMALANRILLGAMKVDVCVEQAGDRILRIGINGQGVIRDDGLYRRLISTVYNGIFSLLFGFKVRDINSKPKIIRRDKYELLQLESDDWFADAEIVIRARELGLKIGETPVHFKVNDNRGSFVKPRAILEFTSNLLKYRFSPRQRTKARSLSGSAVK